MQALFEGILFGLTLAFFLGPAFFTLIQTSIHRGLQSGILLAIGVFLSDLALILLCILGFSQIITDEENALLFGLIGGVLLISFGIVTFKRKALMDNGDFEPKKPGAMTFILKGFFLNFANPFIWFFWMGVSVLVTSNYVSNPRQIYVFFTGALLTVFVTDLAKCIVSHKIRNYLNIKVLSRLNHVVGVLLAIFGVALIIRVILQFSEAI